MKTENTSIRLRKLLHDRNLKQVDILEKVRPFCEKYNVKFNKSDLSQYVAGISEPGSKKLTILALALDVNEAWLMGYDVPMEKYTPDTISENINTSNGSENMTKLPKAAFPINNMHRIPILGYISAGLPIYAEQHIEGYTYTELNGGAEYFALRVKGDSMNALRICDGDIIIVRRQKDIENGDIAVVLVDNENATVKQFFQEGNKVTLVPRSTNPEYAPQFYDLQNTQINILGKVVRNQIDF